MAWVAFTRGTKELSSRTKRRKKIIAIIIVIAVVATGVGLGIGYFKKRETGLAFKSVKGGYAVSWRGKDDDTAFVYIPRTHNGRPVVEISAGAFRDCQVLMLFIPDSVKKIGKRAFGGGVLNDKTDRYITIYTEHATQPASWDTDWNVYFYYQGQTKSYHPTIYGAALDGSGRYVQSVKITENTMFYQCRGGEATIRGPFRDEYLFAWWINPDDDAVPFAQDQLTIAPIGATLVAHWHE